MNEIVIDGQQYRLLPLSAFDQFHVSRRLAPIVPTIAPLLSAVVEGGVMQSLKHAADQGDLSQIKADQLADLGKAAQPLAEALAAISDENANYILHKCLGVVQRKRDQEWAVVCRGDALMFSDMHMHNMLLLVLAVLRTSLGPFMRGLVTTDAATTQP